MFNSFSEVSLAYTSSCNDICSVCTDKTVTLSRQREILSKRKFPIIKSSLRNIVTKYMFSFLFSFSFFCVKKFRLLRADRTETPLLVRTRAKEILSTKSKTISIMTFSQFFSSFLIFKSVCCLFYLTYFLILTPLHYFNVYSLYTYVCLCLSLALYFFIS